MKTPEEIKKSLKICMINEASCEGCAYSGYGCCTKLTSDAIAYISQLENRATIEAEPVRHGRWYDKKWDEHPHMHSWHCSICEYTGGVNPICPSYKYCPNCGARMNAEEANKHGDQADYV